MTPVTEGELRALEETRLGLAGQRVRLLPAASAGENRTVAAESGSPPASGPEL